MIVIWLQDGTLGWEKIKRTGKRWADRAESRTQGGVWIWWSKEEKMEDGSYWAEAAEHRGRGVKKDPYKCGETLLIIFSVAFGSISHSLLFFSFFPPISTRLYYHWDLHSLSYLSLLYLHHTGRRHHHVSLYEKTAGNTHCNSAVLVLHYFCASVPTLDIL